MKTLKDRHRTIQCNVCGRVMRSDTVKRHMRSHKDLLSMNDAEVREELRKRNEIHTQKEERRQRVEEIARQENIPLYHCNEVQPSEVDISSLEEEMLQDNQRYLENIELGKQISMIINKGVIREESLSKYRKEALDLYRKQRPRNGVQVELRPWQQELMEMIAVPTEREVIWVQGMRGNEGKSWLQDYVAASYGYDRVVQLDLKMKTSNVLHALAKRPLSSTDIFLFNEPRAVNNEVCNYGVLEAIKDGIAVSSKYNSDVLHFKTPNVVAVFSNGQPKMKQLSRDRWCVLRITKSGLTDNTNALWKLQKGIKAPTNPDYVERDDQKEENWLW